MSVMINDFYGQIKKYNYFYKSTQAAVYKRNIRKIKPSEKNIRLMIFDFDHTLFYETIFPQVEELLKDLFQQNIYLAIASHNDFVYEFCQRYDIDKYFDIICGFYDFNKFSQMDLILGHYKDNNIIIPAGEILFIDDQKQILAQVGRRYGIKTLRAQPYVGVKKKDIMDMV